MMPLNESQIIISEVRSEIPSYCNIKMSCCSTISRSQCNLDSKENSSLVSDQSKLYNIFFQRTTKTEPLLTEPYQYIDMVFLVICKVERVMFNCHKTLHHN